MKLERFLKNNEQGFTLVEMMVTVAIVGILAAAGIPQYRKTIAKAKKGEAQALLGAIATAESSFFSEYGSYGNNLARMGAESDSNNPKLLYRGGFPLNAVCGNVLQAGPTPANGIPLVATATQIAVTDPGIAGLLMFPRQYSGYNEILQVAYAQEGVAGAIARANVNTSSMIGRSTFNNCATPAPIAGAQPLTTVIAGAETAPMQAYLGSQVVAGGLVHRFRAVAVGYIGPIDTAAARNGGAVTGPANRNRDIWTIDEQRLMVNVIDGSGAN
ncbi:MAG: prepilin-type N-terminal cleavage/methylation domain-containing protein [Proteobacteria bacterium]|nr:prepilin-type N-terminal cleavage/methylation domain-containing protein [Pseudomonadota bacterium]NDG27417.1 prepilin-type N-terminal cleavage/methylation domain-containing protein [Pseudomonadota bacterium]